MQTNSVSIKFDDEYTVAGERLSGEVFISSESIGCKVMFSASGSENLIINNRNHDTDNLKVAIFHHEAELSSSLSEKEEVFPFTFKVPSFAPSSFRLQETISDQRHVKSEIIYEITVYLKDSEVVKAEKTETFIVFGKKAREIVESNSVTQILKSCICIPRGKVLLSIVPNKDIDFIIMNDLKCKILLRSKLNKYIESIVGQIISEFTIKTSDNNEVKTIKAVSRKVYNLGSVEQIKENELYIDFEFNVNNTKDQNAPSCSGHIFQMNYFLQIFAVYNVGWRSKVVEIDQSIIVNPSIRNQYHITREFPEAIKHQLKALEAPLDNINFY